MGVGVYLRQSICDGGRLVVGFCDLAHWLHLLATCDAALSLQQARTPHGSGVCTHLGLMHMGLTHLAAPGLSSSACSFGHCEQAEVTLYIALSSAEAGHKLLC